MNIGQIILYSRKKEELVSFLSEVFEMEIKNMGDGVRLYRDEFSFLVVLVDSSQELQKGRDVVIDFYFDTKEDLEDFHQKVQFIQYRQTELNMAIAPIKNLGHINFFVMRDPDGRKWKFSFREK